MAKILRQYRDFSGGLAEVANDQMQDNQLAEAQNTVPGEGVGLAKARGTTIALPRLPAGIMIRALLEFKPADLPKQTLAFSDDSLYCLLDNQSWQLKSANLGLIKDWFIHGYKLWWLDGQNMRSYDGENISIINLSKTNPTAADQEVWQKVSKSTLVAQRGSRWFYAAAGSSELIFSDIGSPNSLAATNIININTKDADYITALHAFQEGLLIFKERTVHYLSGWDFAGGSDISLIELNVNSGTSYPKTVQKVDNAVFYLGVDGLYSLRIPNMSIAIAATNISNGLLSETLINYKADFAQACVWNGVYYLSLHKEQQQLEYRYYLDQKAFFGPYNQEYNCFSTALQEKALFLGCANGYILKYDDNSYNYISLDNGQPKSIMMRAATKGFDISGYMVVDAAIKRLQIAARQYQDASTNLIVIAKADYNEQSFSISFDESLVYDKNELGSNNWGWQDTIVKEISLGKKAKRLQIIFINDYLKLDEVSGQLVGEPLLIYGLACLYKNKRPRGSRERIQKVDIYS